MKKNKLVNTIFMVSVMATCAQASTRADDLKKVEDHCKVRIAEVEGKLKESERSLEETKGDQYKLIQDQNSLKAELVGLWADANKSSKEVERILQSNFKGPLTAEGEQEVKEAIEQYVKELDEAKKKHESEMQAEKYQARPEDSAVIAAMTKGNKDLSRIFGL